MMVHDCDEVQNLQRQMAKSKIISNQETWDILAPLSKKWNERAETDQVPQIITLQERSFKWSCTARVDVIDLLQGLFWTRSLWLCDTLPPYCSSQHKVYIQYLTI
jgi:hypothetical protein